MKHIGALIGIAVVVFGATFLFTSEWPNGGQDEQVAQVSEEAAPPPAEEEVAQEEAAQEEQVAAEGTEAETGEQAASEQAPEDEATQEAASTEAQPATQAQATRAPADEEPAEGEQAQGGETETAQAETGAEEDAAPDEAAATGGATATAEVDTEALMETGGEIYTNTCAACHGAEGEGAVGPAFADNANLEDAEYVATTIIHGQGGMPPFGEQLSDEDIAAVATYIRNSWGNEFGPLPPDEAEAAR